jgi:hypothetical protein
VVVHGPRSAAEVAGFYRAPRQPAGRRRSLPGTKPPACCSRS